MNKTRHQPLAKLITSDLTDIIKNGDEDEVGRWSEVLDEPEDRQVRQVIDVIERNTPKNSTQPRGVHFEESATKIQANFRGKISRSRMSEESAEKKVVVAKMIKTSDGIYLKARVEMSNNLLRLSLHNVETKESVM